MKIISNLEELEAIYGQPAETSLVKETAGIIPHYRSYIEASPFCALATVGPEGLDCTPRGDNRGFVHIEDERTLMMPDRRGNNRVDSLRNIVRDPRVALLILVPGSDICLRINGEARLTADPAICKRFAVDEKAPRSVIVIKTMAVYFQCARALVRSNLWDPTTHIHPADLPSAGDILAYVSENRVGGAEYDKKWKGRALETLW